MKYSIIAFCFLLSTFLTFGEVISTSDSIPAHKAENLHFSKRQLIIPGICFTYGIASMGSDYLQLINSEIKEELAENIDEKFTIDDFSVFLPAISVYGLNFAGVKGRNTFKDRSLILGTSMILMATSVWSLKSLTHIERPDGSSDNSFPSGHTSAAFAGAEFLYQEYRDVSPWIGVAGYAVATGTGFFRLYNQRHWLSDVVMGAGIGILSTKIAYWTFPYYHNLLTKSHHQVTTMVLPFYDGRQTGMALVINLM